MHKKKKHRFETLIHSQQNVEIVSGCMKEWDDSPVPIFPLLNFGIVRMLAS